MAKLRWDRLMETCVKRGAFDILLIPGMPPGLRVDNGLRWLDVEPLTPVDIAEMLIELSPPDRVNEKGYLDFDVPYGRHRFRVASFGIPSPRFTLLMKLPRPETPAESGAT